MSVRSAWFSEHVQRTAERVALDVARALGLPAWHMFDRRPTLRRTRQARALACWLAVEMTGCGRGDSALANAFGVSRAHTWRICEAVSKRIEAREVGTLAMLRLVFLAVEERKAAA